MAEPGIEKFLESLDPERAESAQKLRDTLTGNIDALVTERPSSKAIDYVVLPGALPVGFKRAPKGGLAYAQIVASKTGLTLHFVAAYLDPATHKWLEDAFARAGRKLDMGSGCIRFPKVADIPYEIIGELVARTPSHKFIDLYAAMVEARGQKR